jgi:hypothetical protein
MPREQINCPFAIRVLFFSYDPLALSFSSLPLDFPLSATVISFFLHLSPASACLPSALTGKS